MFLWMLKNSDITTIFIPFHSQSVSSLKCSNFSVEQLHKMRMKSMVTDLT